MDHSAPAGPHHELHVCTTGDEILAATSNFVASGAEQGQSSFVLASGHDAPWLRRHLNGDAQVIEIDGAGTRSPHLLATLAQHLGRPARGPEPRLRVISQVVPLDAAGWAAWPYYEAVLNEALRPWPVDMFCVLDSSALPDGSLDVITSAHPFLSTTDTQSGANAGFVAPGDLLARRPPPIPFDAEAGPPVRHLVGVTEPALIRRELAAVADRMLTEAQRSDFTVAVTEIVTNALIHGRGRVDVDMWTVADDHHRRGLVVSVRDQGTGPADPLAGMLPPAPGQIGGMGLWIARNWSDQLDIIRTAAGCTVRLVIFDERL